MGTGNAQGESTGNEGAAAVADAPFDVAAYVPEPLRTEPYFESFKGKTVGDVMKSAVEAHKAIGGSVRIPAADAKPEDWDAFYAKMRPESPEKYSAVTFKDETVKNAVAGKLPEFMKMFHQAGLSDRQVKQVMSAYEDTVAGDFKTVEQTIAQQNLANEEVLKKQYGPKFQEMSVQANRVARRFGGDAFVQMIKDYKLQSDPVFFNTFAAIANAVHEDSWVTGDSPVKMLSKEGAKTRVDEILADRTNPYHNSGHPNHGAVAKEVQELRKIMYRKDDE